PLGEAGPPVTSPVRDAGPVGAPWPLAIGGGVVAGDLGGALSHPLPDPEQDRVGRRSRRDQQEEENRHPSLKNPPWPTVAPRRCGCTRWGRGGRRGGRRRPAAGGPGGGPAPPDQRQASLRQAAAADSCSVGRTTGAAPPAIPTSRHPPSRSRSSLPSASA